MTRTEIEEKVRDFMIEDMEIAAEKVHANALLKEDMGIDSLDYVDIIVIVNRIFGFKIKLEEMTNVKTLGDFCDYIEQKIKE
ncbi:MAG: acyl carrier protein [Bacteroidaceae bacterium]|nr:acyl carrier protein [Bacteroidaceae bacterium]